MRTAPSFVSSLVPLLVLLAAPRLDAAEGSAPRRLGLEEAERLAISISPGLHSATARLHAAEVGAKAGISRMLPSIFLSEEYQHWDSAFSIPFPLGPGGAPVVFTARNQDTNSFSATFNQPLLGLIKLMDEYRAQRQGADATAAQLHVAEESLRQAVRVAFLRHFEAKALEEIARQSENELNEQVNIAKAKLKAGVLTNADLLRIQVAAANAQQEEIVAHTQGDVARATILIAVGISPDEQLELVEPTTLIQAARGPGQSFSAAVEQALKARPEILSAKLSIDSAKSQQHAKLLSLLPDVNLEGGYVRVDGQVFAPPNSAFIGIKATWLVWDWGATWFQHKAAQAQTEAAVQELDDKKAQVALDVATELSQSTSARSAVKLAEQSIESAEEAYRVTNALVKAGSATTTDLLESQAALNQARLNLVRAQYQLAIAYVAVQHALGAQ